MKYLASLLLATSLYAQTAAPKPAGTAISGEIAAKDPAGKQLTIKADNGTTYTVNLEEATPVYEVPLGENSMKNAAKITVDKLTVGDRVIARGTVSNGNTMAATRIVAMSKSDVQKKQAEEQADWQKRGVSGIVTQVNPDTHEFTINEPTRGGVKSATVLAGGKTDFHKYAAGSIKFSDAKVSSLGELKVGDQVRVLGDKNADGTQVTAERVVFGTFRLIPATVVSVNAQAGEITVNDLERKRQLVVKVNPDSRVKRLPAMVANMLAARVQGGGTPGAGADSSAGTGAAPAGAGYQRASRPGAGGAPAGDQGGRFGGGRGMANGDLSTMVDRLPQEPLDQLKPGDALIVHSSAGADPSTVTAITILAGAEPILTKRGERPIDFGSWGMDPMGSAMGAGGGGGQ